MANFILNVVNRFYIKLFWIRLILPFTFDVFQVLSESLFIVSNQVFADTEGIIIRCPMKQIVTIFIIKLWQAQ